MKESLFKPICSRIYSSQIQLYESEGKYIACIAGASATIMFLGAMALVNPLSAGAMIAILSLGAGAMGTFFAVASYCH